MPDPSLTGVTTSTAGQTTLDPAAPELDASSAAVEQGTQVAAQAITEASKILSSLFSGSGTGGGGQNPDGTYQPTPYNTPLQPMMQTLGVGDPVAAIPSPSTAQLSELISTARNLMGNSRGATADQFQQQAGQQASNVPFMSGADQNILGAVNQSAGAVGDGRQQMMGVIDTLNTAINALAPLMGTMTGQAGASSLITQAIQVGTSILTTLISVISQISSQDLNQASSDLSAVNADYKVDQQGAFDESGGESGPYTGGTGKAPAWFYDMANELLDKKGITDPVARRNWIAGMETVAQRESGFKLDSINQWDSNAAAGTPSGGLFHFIEPTFRAYADPDLTNWSGPKDQMAAFMNYAVGRYDVAVDGSNLAANIQQADPNRPPKGY